MRGAIALITLLCCLGLGAEAAETPDGLTLERVVIVQRHGVRAPTKPNSSYAAFASQAWPAWPVAPGQLTSHGAANVRLMGGWLRAYYAKAGLLPAQGCPDPAEIALWADGADQRTRLSGEMTLAGAFPGCGLIAHHGPDGQPDRLFHAIEAEAVTVDWKKADASLRDAAGDIWKGHADLVAARTDLVEILDPPVKQEDCKDEKGACELSAPDQMSGQKLKGPLAILSTLSETLLLEYAEGMPAAAVGWGRADAGMIARVMPIHNFFAAVTRQTPYLAVHNGMFMARAVTAALKGQPAFPGAAADARLVIFTGHDTTLSALAGILGLNWTLPGMPDNTGPDVALAFELWRDAKGEEFVTLALHYQTLDQLRQAQPLDDAHPADRVPLSLGQCSEGAGRSCPLGHFSALIERSLTAE